MFRQEDTWALKNTVNDSIIPNLTAVYTERFILVKFLFWMKMFELILQFSLNFIAIMLCMLNLLCLNREVCSSSFIVYIYLRNFNI